MADPYTQKNNNINAQTDVMLANKNQEDLSLRQKFSSLTEIDPNITFGEKLGNIREQISSWTQTEPNQNNEKKGLSWAELIIDNILGLDNEYESFGEKLGKAINQDEIKFLKDAAVGAYEGAKEFVTNPIDTTKNVIKEIKDSVTRLGTEDLDTRLKNMFGVDYQNATDEQVNKAREAVMKDAFSALSLIPATKAATTAVEIGAGAIPGGVKADVIGQTKAIFSGDKEFLEGTPTEKANPTSLSAGFTGDNPPTYERRQPEIDVESRPSLAIRIIDDIFFRRPVTEFVKSLNISKKGILGSNFLKEVEKNPSIADSSILEPKKLINPTKRYSKKELQEIFLKNNLEFFTAASRDLTPRFAKYQRQKDVGFSGGSQKKYFEIPIRSSSIYFKLENNEKRPFKPRTDTHFGDSAIAHVRGSIIKPSGPYTLGKRAPEFSKIIGNQDFLLVEEIQSNLVKGGFLKSNFNAMYDQATGLYRNKLYMEPKASINPTKRYSKQELQEIFVKNNASKRLARALETKDKKFKDLVKEINKENPTLPNQFINEYQLEYNLEGKREPKFNPTGISGGAGSQKNLRDSLDFEKYIRKKLESKGFLEETPSINEEIVEQFLDFYGIYRENISKTRIAQGGEYKGIQEYISPPITKTKQAVEESLKTFIAKAALENVNHIVFPNVSRIKIARDKKFDPANKGDIFYKMYFKELNEALTDLEENYPVKRYSVNLPYIDSEKIDSSGTVLDITELVKKFKVESPRQFAKGGTAMNNQMQMAFMNEGGLTDDGMTKDPVSGNEVPPGSLAKEVRDDIPAQLSEGEYVVPADVARYYGINFFENLRNQAKQGLQNMEQNGRIGGQPVHSNIPMQAANGGMAQDLSSEEMQAIQEIMGFSNGGDNTSLKDNYKTTEQDILKQAEQARQDNYTGTPLGSTLFSSDITRYKTLHGPNQRVEQFDIKNPIQKRNYDYLLSTGLWSTKPKAQEVVEDITEKPETKPTKSKISSDLFTSRGGQPPEINLAAQKTSSTAIKDMTVEQLKQAATGLYTLGKVSQYLSLGLQSPLQGLLGVGVASQYSNIVSELIKKDPENKDKYENEYKPLGSIFGGEAGLFKNLAKMGKDGEPLIGDQYEGGFEQGKFGDTWLGDLLGFDEGGPGVQGKDLKESFQGERRYKGADTDDEGGGESSSSSSNRTFNTTYALSEALNSGNTALAHLANQQIMAQKGKIKVEDEDESNENNMQKGGLMMSKPKKKRGRPKKSGLAGKK